MWKRVAVRQGRQALQQGELFVKHVVPAVMKPARALWNQFIGFLFLCFAVMFGFKTGRLWLDYTKADTADASGEFWRLLMAGFCTAMMLWFGLVSLLRARRISRS